mgnify:CR=1 FL=1
MVISLYWLLDVCGAWTVQVDIDEHEDRTRAVARLRTVGDQSLAGTGLALFSIWWETALAERVPPHVAVQCVVDCYGPVDLVGMMKSASAPIVQGFVGKPDRR